MRRTTRIMAIILALALILSPAMAFESQKRGDRGDAVKEIQARLNELGYSVGKPDGDFGKKTEEAVRSFQKDNGLEATGEVDEATWNTLFGGGGAEEPGEAAVGGVAYERVADVSRLSDLMDPIMKYVDPAADGSNGFDGNVCVNMYYGMKIMRWYHLYLDAGDQSDLASTANNVLKEARASIIVHSMEDGAKEQYPELKEKFAAALAAGQLSMDEAAAPWLEELGIAPAANWLPAEFGLLQKATQDGFNAVLGQ
ncbi:MAG: peptidoglycan-binding protein [Clostridia bacterium]|nr:peptidoglycan-binding protein [Clostridia bacterium]